MRQTLTAIPMKPFCESIKFGLPNSPLKKFQQLLS